LLDGLEQGAQISLFPLVEYVSGEALGERARQLAFVDIFLRVTRNVQQEVLLKIEDVETHSEYLLLPRAAGVTSEGMEIVKRIDLPYPREIASGPARLRDLQVQVEDDSVAVSGILERYIYYIPEATADMNMDTIEEMDQEFAAEKEEKWPQSLKVEELFQYQLHLPGVRAGDVALVYPQTGKCEFAPAEAATLGVSHAALEVKVRQVEEYAIVVPSRVPPGTSMVIYAVKKGDNLLKIARSYGVQPADVAESNGFTEDEILQVGQKLLIPLMLYRR
jgi:LysM repeat protein